MNTREIQFVGTHKLCDDTRDVPRVIRAVVMPPLERPAEHLESPSHAQLPALIACQREHLFRVDVPRTERVRNAAGLTLARELVAVVIAPTEPGSGIRVELAPEGFARLREAHAHVHLRLRPTREFRAERADARTRGRDDDAAFFGSLEGLCVQHAHTDLDDLARLIGRCFAFPARRFDINHVDELPKRFHA